MTGGVGFNPEPQVIAEAIAVYQYNKKKWQTGGLPTLDTMTIPCITMVGMQPMFYLIPVTQALSTAVVTSQYPKTPTKVVKCVIASGPNRPFSEGMMTPEYTQSRKFMTTPVSDPSVQLEHTLSPRSTNKVSFLPHTTLSYWCHKAWL
ncbi:hypothetical protein BGW80DRAFT_1444553 [Lactifluus volemus]|nr:hypothetical protein BGW80DRAFT_1444553 [Lactifluus volemus]